MLTMHPILGVTPALNEVKALDIVMLRASPTLRALDALVDEIVLEAEPAEAQDLFRALEEVLKKFPQFEVEAPEEYAHLQRAIVHLKFVAFPLLKAEEAEDLLKSELMFAVQMEINVRDLLYARLLTFEDGVAQGAMRKHFIQVSKENTEKLGNQQIIGRDGSSTFPPIVGNWLKDYDQFFSTFTLRSSLERLRYLNEGVNAKRLSAAERQNLLKVLEIYDFLRFPSVALKEQGVVPLASTPASAALRPSKGLAATDLMGRIDVELMSAAQYISEGSKNDIIKMGGTLYDNLFPLPGARYDRTRVLGSLVVFARQGWLLRLLSEQNPVREQFVRYLREEGKPEEMQAFNLSPTSPLSLGKFLRFVLVRRMRLSEQDAAKIAVKIGNLLKGAGKDGYVGMAYYDQAEEQFKWKT